MEKRLTGLKIGIGIIAIGAAAAIIAAAILLIEDIRRENNRSETQQTAGESVATDTAGNADVDAALQEEELPKQTDVANESNDNIAVGRTPILIGDSRTVGMYWAASGSDALHEVLLEDEEAVWACKEGIGLTWMKETGAVFIDPKVTEYSDIVILMGVNDIVSEITPSDYISYLNDKSGEWTSKGANVFYCLVGPIRTDLSNGLSEEKIKAWNEEMQAGLSGQIKVLDPWSLIEEIGFKDDLHYTEDTSKEVFMMLLEMMGDP